MGLDATITLKKKKKKFDKIKFRKDDLKKFLDS